MKNTINKKLCECGCGIEIESLDKWNRKRRFVHGHNNRNIKFSEDHKTKMSNASINKPKSDKARENMSITKKMMFKEGLLKTPVRAFKKGNIPWMNGKKHKLESIQKMSFIHKGNLIGDLNPSKRPEVRKKIRLSKLGDKNPMFGKYGKENPSYGKIGILSSNWKGGISFEPYGIEFNKNLKEEIRKRDNYTCQECFKIQEKRKLHVHHIDYNKQNNNQLNLISLCNNCHVKTNYNRIHWENYFKMKMFIKELFNPQNIVVFENNKLIAMEKLI